MGPKLLFLHDHKICVGHSKVSIDNSIKNCFAFLRWKNDEMKMILYAKNTPAWKKYTTDIHMFLILNLDQSTGKLQQCEAKLGYRTCFTKLDLSKWLQYVFTGSRIVLTSYYIFLKTSHKCLRAIFIQILDAEGRVLTRGCSTKRPVFHVECENHVSWRRFFTFLVLISCHK